jgi:hypothetical protein
MPAHAPTATVENPLQAAASQIRSLCDDGEALPSWLDAGSVRRILVHVDNISRSVTTSMQDHVNAAKRLNDFAGIFARFAENSETDSALAARLISVSDNLRAASGRLARADATAELPAIRNGAG